MNTSPSQASGVQLVADYQNAFIAIATSEIALGEAQRSENELMQQLGYWSRGGYLQPGNIDGLQQADVSRASLNAHIKKIQAEQVNAMKVFQLQSLNEEDQKLYAGRKVTIEALSPDQSPFDVVWFNPQSGYRSNEFKRKIVTGTVQEVLLDRNMLVLKPPYLPRVLNHDLEAYVAYVIDPSTAEPMVRINFR